MTIQMKFVVRNVWSRKVYERGTSNVMSKETIKKNKNTTITNNELFYLANYLQINFYSKTAERISTAHENKKVNVSIVRRTLITLLLRNEKIRI